MKKIYLIILITILAGVGIFFFSSYSSLPFVLLNSDSENSLVSDKSEGNESDLVETTTTQTSVVAEGLDTPWAIVFLPQGGMLVTERKGTIRLIDPNGNFLENPITTISSVKEIGEGGLMGITLHSDFSSNNFVYLYYTYSNSSGNNFNRLVRMTYKNNKLEDEKVLIDDIPASFNHNGGRIRFGPDKMLYITTGDAQNPSLAQDTDSLAGKILRVTDEGEPVNGNPFGNEVYSFGHRNPQGIAWDENGNLWEVEHGPSGFETGNDEFNKIEIGRNYGWPEIRGKEKKEGMISPVIESGKGITWAPAGLEYISGNFYFGGLRGEALYRLTLKGNETYLEAFFKGEFGRIREVIAGPDGMLYITTSNRDGRGNPRNGDDKIIKVDPKGI